MLRFFGLVAMVVLLADAAWCAQADGRWLASQAAKVVIGRDGHVIDVELQRSTLGPDMQAEIVRRIRQFEFEPAKKNGVAVETETHLSIQLAVEPDGKQLALKVAGANVTVGMVKLPPPRFPRSQLNRSQGAQVDLRLAYDTEGKVTEVEITRIEPDLKVFREATLKAARQWVFAPEKIDGQPIAGTALIPVTFEFVSNNTGEIKFPDGGHLRVSRERENERQLLSSSTQLRSIGEEVADGVPADATAAKPAG
jgi:TonB family protein